MIRDVDYNTATSKKFGYNRERLLDRDHLERKNNEISKV